jgi:hypothetical protein
MGLLLISIADVQDHPRISGGDVTHEVQFRDSENLQRCCQISYSGLPETTKNYVADVNIAVHKPFASLNPSY